MFVSGLSEYFSYAFRKGDPNVSRINRAILEILPMINKLHADIGHDDGTVTGFCGKAEHFKVEPLNIDNLLGAFAIFLAGHLIGVVLFLGEIMRCAVNSMLRSQTYWDSI